MAVAMETTATKIKVRRDAEPSRPLPEGVGQLGETPRYCVASSNDYK